jgi:hypothetical protein
MPAKKYFTEEERTEAIKRLRKISRPKNRKRTNELARAAYAKNGDAIRARKRKAYKENQERAKGYSRKFRLNNPDKVREILRKSRKKHSKSNRIKAKNWRDKNPEKIRAIKRAWNKKNHAKVIAHNAAVRARRRKRLHPLANKKTMREMFIYARSITKSTGVKHHVDHIIPLAANGWHHEDNMQPLVESLNHNNLKKGGKGSDPFWLSPHIGIKDWRDVPRLLWPLDLVPKYLALLGQHKGETIRWDVAA